MRTLKLRQYVLKRPIRSLLGRVLTPRMVQSVRFQWWCLSSYVPRLVISRLFKQTPQVRGFGAALVPSHLAKQLQGVNVVAPTKMCYVMSKYGSDKGRVHRYTAVYSVLFKERYNQALRVFELGMGSNNPDVQSNMGVFGAPGASLRGWRELFPHALVYGADIDRTILLEEDRIKTF